MFDTKKMLYIFKVELKDGTDNFVYSFDSKMDDGYNYVNIVVNSTRYIMKKDIIRFKQFDKKIVDVAEENWYDQLMEV